MNLKRSKRTDFEIPKLPLVALIDVTFFLLLYFIMAGNLAAVEQNLETALKTDRPGGGSGSTLLPQIVTVDEIERKPFFKVGERVTGDKSTLTATLSKLNKQGGVVIRVTGRAPVWMAAAAIQACKDAGFTKVSYVPRGDAPAEGAKP